MDIKSSLANLGKAAMASSAMLASLVPGSTAQEIIVSPQTVNQVEEEPISPKALAQTEEVPTIKQPKIKEGIVYALNPDIEADKKVIRLFEKLYEHAPGVDKEKPSFLDLSGEWCTPCGTLKPLLEEIKSNQSEREFMKTHNLITVNSLNPTDENEDGAIDVNGKVIASDEDSPKFGSLQALADRLNTAGFPAIARFYRDKGSETWMFEGISNKVVQPMFRIPKDTDKTTAANIIATAFKNAVDGGIPSHSLAN